MGKKEFKSGIDRILGDEPPQPKTSQQADSFPLPPELETLLRGGEAQAKRGRPRTNLRQIEKSSQEGCKPNETRATFIVREDDLAKLKALAYWERLTLKDIIQGMIAEHLARFEADHGEIKPIPGGK